MNIVLKAVDKEDFEWILNHRNNPALNINFNQPMPLTYADQEQWYVTQVLTKRAFAYVVLLGKLKIGYVAVQNINWVTRSAELSHFVCDGFDAVMFAALMHSIMLNHAFNSLNLHRVYTICFAFNRIYDEMIRGGFKKEGVLRDYCFKGGKYHDGYLISILDHEYKALFEGLQ